MDALAAPALDPAAQLALRGALSVLWAAAAAHKLRDLPAFCAALADYRLLPAAAVGPVAATLAMAEAGLAAGLWLGPARGAAAWGSACLLVLYALAIAVNLARGRRHIDCGCAGPAARQPIGGGLVLRNGVLALAALAVALPAGARPLAWPDGVSALFAAGVLLALHAASAGLLANAARLREGRGA